MFAACRGLVRHNRHSRSAAPLAPVPSIVAVTSRHAPSARATVVNRARGHVDPDDASPVVGLLRTAARGGAPHGWAGYRRRGRVVDAAGRPPSFARGRWFEALELVSHDGAGSPARLAAVDGVRRAATSRAGFNAPGLLRRPVVRAQSKSGVTRPFAVNGWRVPGVVCRVSPPLASPRAARRVIRASWPSRASRLARAHATGPSNTQMEPTRPTVLCDPVTAARGSFATFGGSRMDTITTQRFD